MIRASYILFDLMGAGLVLGVLAVLVVSALCETVLAPRWQPISRRARCWWNDHALAHDGKTCVEGCSTVDDYVRACRERQEQREQARRQREAQETIREGSQ